MTDRISISPAELETLSSWLLKLDKLPHRIILIAEKTGIGTSIRAEIETDEGEGLWKDLTDYSNW